MLPLILVYGYKPGNNREFVRAKWWRRRFVFQVFFRVEIHHSTIFFVAAVVTILDEFLVLLLCFIQGVPKRSLSELLDRVVLKKV